MSARVGSSGLGLAVIWLTRAAFAIALALVVWQSLVPPDAIVVSGPSDKVLHFGGYAVLGLLAALSRFPVPALVAWLGVSLVGAAVELLQALTPQRAFELQDILADAAGAAVGVLIGALALRLLDRLRRPAAA